MDHAEALEALELAAVEPQGPERLEAGDTPEAAALAGHLIECSACATEWQRLRADAALLRLALGPATASPDAIAAGMPERTAAAAAVDAPPVELRDRTLRLVREVGRQRGLQQPQAAERDAPAPAGDATSSGRGARALRPLTGRPFMLRPLTSPPLTRLPLARIATLAAVIVLAAGLLGLAFLGQQDADRARRDRDSIAALIAAQQQLAARPDAQGVRLVDASGAARGSLLFSRSNGDLVMLATGLSAAPAGRTYSCWVESSGTVHRLGIVEVQRGIGYWWGWSGDLAAVQPGARFGVSLVDAGSVGSSGAAGSGQLVLSGTLGS